MPEIAPLTAADVRRLAPNARPDIVKAIVEGWDTIIGAGIDTPLRLAHFFAQILTETGGFQIYIENGNYNAKNLADMWDAGNWHRYFPGGRAACIAMAEQCRKDHGEALFNLVYSNRMGNGPPESGDGWRYRGRGLIQTTGRDSYRRFNHEFDPDALTDPDEGLVAAVGEFARAGCIPLADADNVEAVRRRINGGLNGIAECRRYLTQAKAFFAWPATRPDEPWAAPDWQRYPSPKWAWAQDTLNRAAPRLPSIPVDGLYGPLTRNSITAFQRREGLPETGVADDRTVAKLKEKA